MKTIARTFAIPSLAIAFIGATMALTATPAQAGHKSSGGSVSSGSKGVSDLDLGSGRFKSGSTSSSNNSGNRNSASSNSSGSKGVSGADLGSSRRKKN